MKRGMPCWKKFRGCRRMFSVLRGRKSLGEWANGNEGLLQGMRLSHDAHAFQRDDDLPCDASNRGDAGGDGKAIREDHAGTTLSNTAAELWSVQSEIISKDVEQRSFRVCLGNCGLPIHVENNHLQSHLPAAFHVLFDSPWMTGPGWTW